MLIDVKNVTVNYLFLYVQSRDILCNCHMTSVFCLFVPKEISLKHVKY